MKAKLLFIVYTFQFLLAGSMSVGDKVSMVAHNVQTRDCTTTYCDAKGRIPKGTIGILKSGPYEGNSYIWWLIEWENGVTGYTPTPKNDYSWYYEKPSGLSPGKNSSNPEIINDTRPTLSWNTIDGVHHYSISIIEKESGAITYHENIDGDLTSYRLPNSLKIGKRYLWSVIPFDDDDDIGLKADYVYFDVKTKANSAYDLTIRPDDITIRSQSGDDNILNIGEEFDIRVNIRNIGDADSDSYKVKYYYQSSNYFDTDYNRGTDVGDSDLETSDDIEIIGKVGTQWVKVCVYNNENDADKNNDCGIKFFEVYKSADTVETPSITNISPTQAESSLEPKEITLTGENFTSSSIVEMSRNGIDYTEVTNPLNQTSTTISFKEELYAKNGKVYFRVKNASNTSEPITINVAYQPPHKPKLTEYNENPRYQVVKSGEPVNIALFARDLDDAINNINNYTISINWGDGNQKELLHPYNTRKSQSYTYTTNRKDITRTITIQAIDSTGHRSSPLQLTVVVKGTKSSGGNNGGGTTPTIPVSHPNVAKTSDCQDTANAVGRSVNKATGAEQLSLTPLKVAGLLEVPFTLNYNSLLTSTGHMSQGWSHNYAVSSYIALLPNGDRRVYWDNSVKKYNDFTIDVTTHTYTSSDIATIDDTLILNDNQTYTLTRKNGMTYTYNKEGYITSIANYKNQGLTIEFNSYGELIKVTEPISGVYLQYHYTNHKLTSVQDHMNREVTLTYNSAGLLETLTQPDGTKHLFNYLDDAYLEQHMITDTNNHKSLQYFKLTYHDDSRVSSELDGNNHISSFYYEEVNSTTLKSIYTNEANETTITYYNNKTFAPQSVTYPDNTQEKYTYYVNGKRKTFTNRAGYTTHYTYDDKGNLAEVTYHNGNKERYTYDDNRNILTKQIVDTNQTYTTTYTYSENNLIHTHLPTQEEQSFTYNTHNQVTSKTIGGKTTYYRYNAKGYLKEVETPKGLITTYTYDDFGRLTKENNPKTGTLTYTYDAMDRIKTIKNALGKAQKFTYDFLGNKIEERDYNNQATYYKYDQNNNLKEKTDALGNTYTFEYDHADRLIKTINPFLQETLYTYDAMGRVVTITNPRGFTTTYTHDAIGNIKSETDANGTKLFTKTYDANNNLIEIINTLNQKTTTTYNVFNKPSLITDPLKRVTKFKYDAIGRLTKVTNNEENSATQTYHPQGGLDHFTDANEHTTNFTYDDDGNLLSTTTASESKTIHTYNTRGLVATSTNGRGDVTTFAYDALGRVTTTTDPEGTITYTYDDNSNLKTIKENGKRITKTYDALNRLKSYTNEQNETITYTYDKVGNLKTLTYPDNTKIITYTYDENSNLKTVKDGDALYHYTYDYADRLIQLTRPNGTTLTREYNTAGQLISQTDKTPKGEVITHVTYTYDDVGNIIKEAQTPKPKPPTYVHIQMHYTKGNLLNELNGTKATFDKDDNLLNIGTKTFTYDSRNRLKAYADINYTYNAQNHRVAQTTHGNTTHYTINPNAPLSQLLIRTNQTGKTYYTYGLGLLSQENQGKKRYYHYDLRGSTLALTDEHGNVVDRFSYTPYAGVTHTTGNTQTPFLYNGRDGVMTDTNGLYHMRARYYDPKLRRFINRDTLLGTIGSMATLNRFGYVEGNPVMGIDPLGLFFEESTTDESIQIYLEVKSEIMHSPNHNKASKALGKIALLEELTIAYYENRLFEECIVQVISSLAGFAGAASCVVGGSMVGIPFMGVTIAPACATGSSYQTEKILEETIIPIVKTKFNEVPKYIEHKYNKLNNQLEREILWQMDKHSGYPLARQRYFQW